MRAPVTLGLYGVGLIALFTGSLVAGQVIVPDEVSARWMTTEEGEMKDHNPEGMTTTATARGLSLDQDGYLLQDLIAPDAVGEAGTLSFAIIGPDGAPVTAYDASHEKELHLIVVRSDGGEFQHVHPRLGPDGNWSLPWAWRAAGSYRIFADFVPTELGTGVTLSRVADVSGEQLVTTPRTPTTTAHVDGFDLTVEGLLSATETSTLSFTVTRDGQPVTTLEPYLGAFGHLVTLRGGDLAYLHVHPEGEPGDGTTDPGPVIEFMTEAPTAGTYLLYLDFKVDGVVRTAEFVLAAADQSLGGSHD